MHPLQGASFLSTPLQGGILKPPALRVVGDYTDADVADFLNRLRIAATLVEEVPHLTVVRDPNDDMVIATAVQAQAAYIVTRDNDLLSLQQYEDITVISPEAFIAIVRERGRL